MYEACDGRRVGVDLGWGRDTQTDPPKGKVKPQIHLQPVAGCREAKHLRGQASGQVPRTLDLQAMAAIGVIENE